MLSAEALAAAKAKQRHTQTKETPKAAAPLLCPDSAAYHKQMHETYLEEYFDVIKKFSFPSLFHALSIAELQALIKAHEVWTTNKQKRAWTSDPALVALAGTVDALKAELKTQHIFVRLSSRSPKDAALSSERLRILYRDAMKRLEADAPPPAGCVPSTAESRQLHALYISSTQALASEARLRL